MTTQTTNNNEYYANTTDTVAKFTVDGYRTGTRNYSGSVASEMRSGGQGVPEKLGKTEQYGTNHRKRVHTFSILLCLRYLLTGTLSQIERHAADAEPRDIHIRDIRS